MNKSNESRNSKKSPTSETTPVKANRRKRKPNVTMKVSASEMSFSENDMDIESDILASVIACEPMKASTTESDECETIDKIAQMISSTTAAVPLEDKQEKTNDLIEHQLEQMFADAGAVDLPAIPLDSLPATLDAIDAAAATPAEVKTKKTPGKPRKKKVDGEPVKKKPKIANAGKLKNGKLGKKGSKAGESTDNSKSDSKAKAKENGGKSKAKPDVAPFVQIQKDGTFSIVNQTSNGDDDAEKSVNKTKKVLKPDKSKVIRGLHVSTLSKKYDTDKRDTTWVCVFCKLGPHKHKLGDLFGPYIISKTSEDYVHCLNDPADDIFRQSNKNKFVKAQLPPPSPEKPKKKRKSNTTVPIVNGAMTNEELFTGMSKVDDNNFEVWFHEDCIVWSGGVYIIGTKIIGMETAIWSSTRFRCDYCHKNGAMLSCLARDCKKPAHFSCARKDWKLDDDFKTFCEAHH